MGQRDVMTACYIHHKRKRKRESWWTNNNEVRRIIKRNNLDGFNQVNLAVRQLQKIGEIPGYG